MLQNELQQAKNRNRAIAITDIAIRKIPRIQLEGFQEIENEYIRRYHQHLLRKAQELCIQNGNNEYEYGMLVDLHTWECVEIEGVRSGVYIDSVPAARNALKYGKTNSLLYMHNHPSTGTFSAVDVKTFLLNPAIYIMTAVGNDGSVYVLQKTIETNSTHFFEEYLSRVDKYRRIGCKYEATLAINDMLKKASKYGIIYQRGGRRR